MTFVALSVAMWQLYSTLQPLREEVVRLRNEVGNLTLEDSDRDCVHGIQIETGNPLFWKWKVYLPDQKDYQLGTYVGKFPSNWTKLPPKWEAPNTDNQTSDQTLCSRVTNPSSYRREAEIIVAISIIRNKKGELVVRQDFGGISRETPLNRELEKLVGGSILNGGPGVGPGGTSRSDVDEPLPMLQQRWDESYDFQNGIEGEARGIIVWIEPVEKANAN